LIVFQWLKIPHPLWRGTNLQNWGISTCKKHVGLGKACEVAKRDMKDYIPNILELEKQLKKELLKARPDISFNGDQYNKIPGILSINIPGINNELFCKQVSDEIAISTGSACSLGEGSYVLNTLNITTGITLRITFSKHLDINYVETLLNSLDL